MSNRSITRRVCRTCPSVIAAVGESDQCRPCAQRSAAVRTAVAVEPHPTPVKASKPHDCKTDGHHACRHFVAVYQYVKQMLHDSDFCPICNVDAEGDDDVVHLIDCALIKLVNAEEARKS